MKPYIHRFLEFKITKNLARGKSILLLGPRQTGKTTLIEQQIKPDIIYSFSSVATRQRYEKNPELLELELEERIKAYTKPPLVFIDEVQKLPCIMDSIQMLIDTKKAQFILSGSSARKLKNGRDINLLPGRVVACHMPPCLYQEIAFQSPSLESLLLYGSLPGIITEPDEAFKDTDLYSYVSIYLEDEIRKEALVRNVGHFARFLQIAAGEAGEQLSFTRLSQDIGISSTTIANFYQILEDCLLVLRIDPLSDSYTKRRLIKSPKYLFFDLGVRRACANEGVKLSQQTLGALFEQYVGIELFYYAQESPSMKLYHWRDTAGPEIDYVLDVAQTYYPIEVKWTEAPTDKDARHLKKFLLEYPQASLGYIVCRTPYRYKLSENIMVIPWQEIAMIFQNEILKLQQP